MRDDSQSIEQVKTFKKIGFAECYVVRMRWSRGPQLLLSGAGQLWKREPDLLDDLTPTVTLDSAHIWILKIDLSSLSLINLNKAASRGQAWGVKDYM